MDLLAGLGSLAPLTPTAVVLLAVLLIFRGQLVPKLYYDEMRTSRDRLQAAVEKRDETIADLVGQQADLIDALQTTKHALEALPPKQGG